MLGANMVSEESFSPASRITHWAVGGAERRLRVHPNSSCSRIQVPLAAASPKNLISGQDPRGHQAQVPC